MATDKRFLARQGQFGREKPRLPRPRWNDTVRPLRTNGTVPIGPNAGIARRSTYPRLSSLLSFPRAGFLLLSGGVLPGFAEGPGKAFTQGTEQKPAL